jgi:hypothetical protein
VSQELVAAVAGQQWAAPTPCTDWDVRALVSHVVSGNRLFAGVLTGRTTVEEFRRNPPGDVLGDRPVVVISMVLVAASRSTTGLGKAITRDNPSIRRTVAPPHLDRASSSASHRPPCGYLRVEPAARSPSVVTLGPTHASVG